MKQKVVTVLVLLCIIAAFLLPISHAAGTVYFSAINNTILPLNDATMPAYIDGLVYLPYTFYNSDELGIYSIAGGNTARIYSSSSKKLDFDVAQSTVFDQDGNQKYLYSARAYNGTIYIPVKLICEFFGFTYNIIQADPAPIVRVKTSSNSINDLTFPTMEITKSQMQLYYDAYTGKPNPSASPTSSADTEQTYQNVTIYLSFFDLSGGKLDNILDTLISTNYKCCFFVTKDEIAGNADLLRRAAGAGHMIGIWLKNGTYSEYQEASSLLFEAAKLKTVIVTAGDAVKAAADMAKAEDLVFWRSTRSYNAAAKFSLSGLTDSLATVSGRESIAFACSGKTTNVLRSFTAYLQQYKYSVRRITETSIPIETLD